MTSKRKNTFGTISLLLREHSANTVTTTCISIKDALAAGFAEVRIR